MALAIDTTFLTREAIPRVHRYLDHSTGYTRRFQIYRMCVHATVVHDASTVPPLDDIEGIDVARQEALDWQPDQDDDLDDVEVLHHLKQMAVTSPFLEEALSQTERTSATTTLVASLAVQSPLLTAAAQRRPLSSFRRYSLRQSVVCGSSGFFRRSRSSFRKVIPDCPGIFWYRPLIGIKLKIMGARDESWTAWQVQFDFMDLLSQRSHPSWRPQKRGRSTLNPFHRVSSSAPMDPCNHLPEAKRFKGVRYRLDRRTWAAEMKPPKYKNKVSLGEFKSQTQAARAVDVAFYYYGKLHLLNFSDTPHLLSTMPPPVGLGVDDRLRFVKQQAKLVSSIASTLPSDSPASITLAIPESSSLRDCTADNLEFRSFSEVASFLSCGDADEEDDGISVQPDPMAGLAGNSLMEPNVVAADAGGVISGTLQEQQSLLQWSSEDGFDDPWAPSSSGWDCTEHSRTPGLTNNSATPSLWMDDWIGSLLKSPPVGVTSRPPSASNFHYGRAQGLLELRN